MNWKHSVRRKTQDPRFLWRMVFAILGGGLVCAAVVQFVPRPDPRDLVPLQQVFRSIVGVGIDADAFFDLMSEKAPIEHRLVGIAYFAPEDEESADKISALFTDDSQHQVVRELIRSVQKEEPTAALIRMADQPPPVRYANHAAGAFYLTQRDFNSAGSYFEAEGRRPDAEISRQFAVDSYTNGDHSGALARLADMPEYQELISSKQQLLIAQAERDWQKIFWTIPRSMLDRFEAGFPTVLAILAGLGWFVVALQLGQWRRPDGVRWWLCLLGVFMGGLSIWLTHLLIVWQELDWGITSSYELMDGIKYYVVGVGLREETAKLVMLLPLMPLIVRRGSTLEAVVVSACVGLGFAIVENLGYFAASGGGDSMGRFLTANFAHMAMTGLIGLAVARAFWNSNQASHAALTFLVVVLAHGAYDATIALPALAEYSIAGMIIFILMSYAFFQEIRTVYKQEPETVSLTATFLFVVCSLTSLTIVYMAWQFGFKAGMNLLGADIVSLGVMVYMYLREMPNSMIVRH